MRVCSRKRPTIERTVMFSETPSIPGRSEQNPRTISWIRTPAWEARYRALMTSVSMSWFILAMMAALRPALACSISASI